MVDAMFIGAHPDDVEILGGGLVARMAADGKKVVIADATRGEMGTRGTPEERDEEARTAAEILGVTRINLNLPDGRIAEDIPAATRRVVEALRVHRPTLVFTHEPGDHHPDHNAVSQAVKFGFFQSNVLKYDTGQERFKPKRLFYFIGSRDRWPEEPSFIVDITDVFEQKMESLRAFKSQLQNSAYKGPATYISGNLGWHMMEARASFFGTLIGVKYGEPFRANEPLRIDDPLALSGL
ncbi:bacillithiol biosynthesis deacetylase BshB1 [bacterium]|nr:bacillithiol biosynthesis deacetylase BshB1 [bacterium]